MTMIQCDVCGRRTRKKRIVKCDLETCKECSKGTDKKVKESLDFLRKLFDDR